MKLLVAVVAASILSLTGCSNVSAPADAPPADASPRAAASPAPGEVAATPPGRGNEGACKGRTIPEQAGSHLVGDNEPPVPYNSTPPTSGWHSSGTVTIGVAKQPLSEPEQVSVLEAGGAVVSYRALPPRDLVTLRRLVRGQYAGRVALTQYPKLQAGEVAVTAWGRLLLCDGLVVRAMRDFVAKHVAEDVGPTDH